MLNVIIDPTVNLQKFRTLKTFCSFTSITVVIKPGPDIDPIYELGHWFNQWVIGRTVGSNKKNLKFKNYIYIYIN